jgi:hypothetical protein
MTSNYEHILTQAMALPASDRLRLISALANQLTQSQVQMPQTETERIALLNEICGKYSHIKTSVDDFLERKREEVELEESRYRAHHPEELN